MENIKKNNFNQIHHVWDRAHNVKGDVLGVGTRYCAACGRVTTCLTVRWPPVVGGRARTTFPCVRGMRILNEHEMEIE